MFDKENEVLLSNFLLKSIPWLSYTKNIKKGIDVSNCIILEKRYVEPPDSIHCNRGDDVTFAFFKEPVIEETQEELLTDLINIYNGNGSILDTFEIKRKK